MDLIDLIGDSRTDSLPAGFLRSIKIKYKQESSRVFPPGTPYKTGAAGAKANSREGAVQRTTSAASDVSVPSFMGWRVPSRLIQQNRTQLQSAGGCIADREKLESRMSMQSRRSITNAQIHAVSKGKEELPRLEPANSVRKTPSQSHIIPPVQTPLPAMRNWSKELSREKEKSRDKSAVQDLEEAEKLAVEKAIKKSVQPYSLESVNAWLKTATDKERELALKFFSTLSGVKTDKLDMLGQKLSQDHTEGNCEICDTGRIEGALEALARDGTVLSRGKLLYNPKRTPDITKHSCYQKAKPAHVRQQFQTWHHLPVYKVPSDGAINKSAMFTQPHRAYGRHFTIHPEWGLHKPVVL